MEELTSAASVRHAAGDDAAVLPSSNRFDEYGAVVALTERLFPGPVDVQREQDPEIQGHSYFDLNVVAEGALEDILSRDTQWHRELARLALHSPNIYCLNIDVQVSE
ncbi:MAG TPA: hypothetical protein VF278_25145 [Pirellulales bacterium]